jgi:hypothetical protein
MNRKASDELRRDAVAALGMLLTVAVIYALLHMAF